MLHRLFHIVLAPLTTVLLMPLYLFVSADLALADSSAVTYHDREGYEISFHRNGKFTAVCKCVSIEQSVSMCNKIIRTLVILKTGDKNISILEWQLTGTMKSGARFDLRQACYLQKSESEFCCVGPKGNYESSKQFYHAELKSTKPRLD